MPVSPRNRVGGITGERSVLLSTPARNVKREAVTYESTSVWFVIVVLVVLFFVFFGVWILVGWSRGP